jgi:antitoxin CcdA
MRMNTSHSTAPKRATNLSLNAATLDTAKALGINVSQTVDALLAAEVRRQYWQRWAQDNQEAIAQHNARIESEGLPLASFNAFASPDLVNGKV